MNIATIKPVNKKISGILSIPGSKSYTNRALIMAAMTKGKVIIHNPLISDDIHAMVNCLNTLGITTKIVKDSIIVSGDYTQVKDKHYDLAARLRDSELKVWNKIQLLINQHQIEKFGTTLISTLKDLNL